MYKVIRGVWGKTWAKMVLLGMAMVLALLGISILSLSLWNAGFTVTGDKRLTPTVRLHLQTAETRHGKVQYDMHGTQGPVILSVHGGFGGADQGRLFASWLQNKDIRILSPSRPGYLSTPLSSGTSHEEQADLLVALLDALRIEKVSVISYSAGGPVAYTLAARYPERVQALISIDSTSRYTPTDSKSNPLFSTSLGQKVTKLSAAWFTSSFLESTLTETAAISSQQRQELADHILQSPDKLAFFRASIDTIFPYDQRKPGDSNDASQLRKMNSLPLKDIHVPTLVMHDADDRDVPFYNGVFAYESIPGAERYWMEGGGHLGFWLSPKSGHAQDKAWSFLQEHAF